MRTLRAGIMMGASALVLVMATPSLGAEVSLDELLRSTADAASAPQEPSPRTRPVLNTTGRVLSMVMPLKEDGRYLGDVEVRVTPDDTIEIATQQVFNLIREKLSGDAVQGLMLLAEPGVYANMERFEALGLPMSFDPQTMELGITLPVSARARQSIGLAELEQETFGEFTSPEAFTAFLNLRTSLDYTHVGASEGFSDPSVFMDGATRIGRIVFEAEASYDGFDGEFRRNGTRAVYDDIKRMNRWTAGDLRGQSRGLQGGVDLAGISVERAYGMLDPQRNLAPRGGQTFSLDRAATVEAVVNGRVVRTLRLDPGTYDVSDFPFVQGSNDIDLIITDDVGRREVMSFSLFIDRTQLATGLSEYGFYGGVIADRDGDGTEYGDDLSFSGFYRRGLSDRLTMGGNVMYSDAAAVVGAEMVWGTSFGTIGGDVAFSDLRDAGSGWALNVTYERLIQTEAGGTSIMAAVETRSRSFGSSNVLAVDNPYVLNATFGMNKSFGDQSFAGVQARYALGRDNREDEGSLRFTYGRRLGAFMNLIADVDYTIGSQSEGIGARLALVRRFGQNGSARAEYDTRNEQARLGYQTSGGQGIGAWSAAANLDVGSDLYGLNGTAAYMANRADLGFAHTTAYAADANEISSQRTSVRVGSSIAYAGGKFAIGRPISDGFMIVAPYSGADDVQVEVEPMESSRYAQSGLFGPALFGQVSSYSPRTVTYDAREAPPGFDVGQGATRILAPYRAGYLVTVGSSYGLTVIGSLLDYNGEPLVLLSGEAIEIGGEERRVTVFTNRQGVFGASGLKAGRWRIQMIGDPGPVYEVTIPESDDGIARIGTLRPIP